MARGSQSGGQHHPDIPLLPAPLIGRRAELTRARELLTGGARLLTLTGPPGVGKTSLALALGGELHTRFPDGAAMVELAAIADASQVASAIADVLGAAGRREAIGRLIGMLRRREMLLLLDNFEQVVEASAVVAELLAACPGLTILVTSRIVLRLRWEQELPIPPLRLPAPDGPQSLDTLGRVPAVRLFAERARAVSATFSLTEQNVQDVATVCTRLDGLPLAIELAAARVRLLTPQAMVRELSPVDGSSQWAAGTSGALRLLADGPRDLPARQQTLRDAITWSYTLLDPAQQRLFRRLAVFVGGSTVEAAEAVCDVTWMDLASLVESSLLRLDHEAGRVADGVEPRLRMLEMVREYAAELLAVSDDAAVIRRRHLDYFVGLAETAGPHLLRPEQNAWLGRLDQERGNLQAAVRWAVEAGEVESVFRLGAALFRFWRTRSDQATAREQVQAILALATQAPHFQLSARALAGAGDLAVIIGDYPAAERLFAQSLELARRLDDPLGIAAGLRELGRLAGYRGSYEEADRLNAESLAILEQHGDLAALANTLRELGMIRYLAGDPIPARALFERGLAAARQLGDRQVIDNLTFGRALTHHVTGEIDVARALYEECLALDRTMGHRRAEGSALNNLGHLALLRGDLDASRTLLRESLLASREGGDRRRLAFTLSAVAGLLAMVGAAEQALRLDAAGLGALEEMGATLASAMRALYNQALAPAHTVLGPDGVAAAVEAGRRLPLDEAVDEALALLADDAVVSGRSRRGAAAAGPGTVVTRTVPATARGVAGGPGPDLLTRREREVAVLLARGLTNRQIATELVLSERTAGNYVQRVMNRLGLENRVQVAAWAVARRLADPPS